MTKIEEMLKDLCPNGVEWKELGEVLDYEQPTNYIVASKDYNDSFDTPVLTAGQSFILGYTNEKDGVYKANSKNPVIIFDDFTTASKWVDFDFKVKSSAMKILTAKEEFKEEILIRYVWHCLGTITYKPEQHGRQWIGIYSKIKIPIPPLEIQQEIVQILDKFTDYVTELTAELTAELTLRQKQYSYYRDNLLSFEDEVYQVEWKTLNDICEIIRGNGLQKKDFVEEGIPCIHYGQIYTYYGLTANETKSFVSKIDSEKLKKAITGDIIVATTSENVEDVGKSLVWKGESDVCIGGHSCILRTSENPEYVNYFMRSVIFQKEKERQVVGTKVIELYPKNLAKIPIPVPPLSIQSRIVQVLDNFDTVCNDLNIGLPKEIALRQKQYDYFRDKLLTFTAEGVYPDSGQWTVEWAQSDLIRLLQWVFGTIRVELGVIAIIQRGASPRPIAKYITEAEDGISWIKIGDTSINSKYVNGTAQKITLEGALKSRILKKGSFIMSNSMSYGRPYILSINGAIHDGWASISDFEKHVNSDFLYHCLSSKRTQNYWDNKINSGSVSNLNSEIIKSLTLTLPSLAEQCRIATILDGFEIITSDLSQGLPKEIKLRQKQYEYFRDKLLKF